MYFGLYIKYLLFVLILRKCGFYRQIFEKYSNTKFHENLVELKPSSMRADGRTDGQTDMTKLRVPFRNFANSTKHGFFAKYKYLMYRMLLL